MVFFLCVETFLLLEEDKSGTRAKRNSKNNQTSNESQDAVGNDEAKNGTANSASCPCDVTPLKTHKFKGPLQPPEEWVVGVTGVFACAFHPSVPFSR